MRRYFKLKSDVGKPGLEFATKCVIHWAFKWRLVGPKWCVTASLTSQLIVSGRKMTCRVILHLSHWSHSESESESEWNHVHFSTLFVLKYSDTCAFTCFPQPSICRARIVAGSQQETRSAAETVLLAGAGPPHGDPLLRRHGQVATTAAVGRQHCGGGNRVGFQATRSFYSRQTKAFSIWTYSL